MTQLALSRAVLDRLAHVSTARGAPSLGDRLATLDRWVRADLIAFEAEIAAIPRGARVVHAAAHHLLDLGGKLLRPLCVALGRRSFMWKRKQFSSSIGTTTINILRVPRGTVGIIA